MIYVLLTIVATLLLLVLFKLFQRFNVNVLIAIIVNYITAAVTGILFLDGTFSVTEIWRSEWLAISTPLGGVFIAIFFCISQTAQRISMSTASVANKMSVVLPVLFSVLYLHETITVVKTAGIYLALLAVYLSTRASEHTPNAKGLFWLPLLVFIGSGIIDITINATSAFYITSGHDSALFSISTFLSAFIIGLALIIFQLLVRKINFSAVVTPRNIIGGILLGIPNYFSIFCLLKALDEKMMSSAQLFTLLNLSNVVLAALVGWLFFKEKLGLINLLGIAVAIVAIILITL